jgi:hypothetical protein
LNAVLDAEGFDRFVEALCAKFYAPRFGRPSLTPGIYFVDPEKADFRID